MFNIFIFLSTILGSVVSAYLGENSIRSQSEDDSPAFKNFSLRAQGANAALSADSFASFSLTAQHGNFQRLFLDLTRLHARLDIPSGSKFISGAVSVAHDLYKSQIPTTDAIQAVCPNVMLSFQQQVTLALSKH